MAQRALIFLGIFLLVAIGLLAWHSQYGAKAIEEKRVERLTKGSVTSLSPEEVALIIEGALEGQPQQLAMIAESNEQKEKILKSLEEIMAMARQARLEGLHNDPKVHDQLELNELQILAFAYEQKLKNDKGKPDDPGPPLGYAEQLIPKEEIEAFWKQPESEKKFEKLLKFIETQNPMAKNMPDEQKQMLRNQWAVASVAAKKAKEAGLDQQPKTRMQLAFQNAQVLARAYGEKHAKDWQVTKEEIAAYVKEHPELDASKTRERAEEILKRAKAGEDFAKLAAEYSSDPGSKDKGGLYENIKKGQFVPEFEQAALSLQPGQIFDKLVESQYGFHIIKLENKGTEKDKDGKEAETFTARHILIETTSRDETNPFAQPVSLEQKSRAEAQKAKQEKIMKGILARNHITLPKPEEIKINVPEMPKAPMGMDGEGLEEAPVINKPTKPADKKPEPPKKK